MNDPWSQLSDLFGKDEGVLVEIWLDNLSPQGVSRVYNRLLNFAPDPSEGGTYCTPSAQAIDLLGYPRNAAALVARGERDPFHLLIQGLTVGGVTIPDLGAFVFKDSICLDHRPGESWGSPQLSALFALLFELQQEDTQVLVALDKHATPTWQERFRSAWGSYLAQRRVADIGPSTIAGGHNQ